MKKLLIIISSLIILGCGEKVETKAYNEKSKMANLAILKNDSFTQKNIDTIMLKLKEQMNNEKLKDKATKEYNDWLNAIYYAEFDKKKIEKEKKKEFFQEVMFLLIKNNLRDPESYVLEDIFFTQEEDTYNIRHYYRAKNGFGGYAKGEELITLELAQEDFSKLPQVIVNDIITKRLKERIKNF
ncbi:MAG: hypothetical protein ACRC4T_15595 [Cetobacterium sp.]